MARMCLDDRGVDSSWQLRTVRHQRARVVSTLTDPNVLETSILMSSEPSTGSQRMNAAAPPPACGKHTRRSATDGRKSTRASH
jgi:hypothetical protein